MTEIEELRARVEALEATQQRPPHQDKLDRLIMGSPLDGDDGEPIVLPSSPASSLAERVADAIGAADDHEGWRSEARAAILEVAAWLRLEISDWYGADRLEQEATR